MEPLGNRILLRNRPSKSGAKRSPGSISERGVETVSLPALPKGPKLLMRTKIIVRTNATTNYSVCELRIWGPE